MTPDAFRDHLTRRGYSFAGFAREISVDERTARRWADGSVPVPVSVQMLLQDDRLKRKTPPPR